MLSGCCHERRPVANRKPNDAGIKTMSHGIKIQTNNVFLYEANSDLMQNATDQLGSHLHAKSSETRPSDLLESLFDAQKKHQWARKVQRGLPDYSASKSKAAGTAKLAD